MEPEKRIRKDEKDEKDEMMKTLETFLTLGCDMSTIQGLDRYLLFF